MKRKSVSQQAEVVAASARLGQTPSPEKESLEEKAARFAREAIKANRPMAEAAWRAGLEEWREYERLFRAWERKRRRRKSSK